MSRRRPRRRRATLGARTIRARLAAGLVLAGMVLVGCGAAPSATPGTTPTGATATATPSSSPAAATPPTGTSPSPAGPSVPYDAALLEILPAELDGLPRTPTPEVVADVGSDPAVVAIADGLAYAVYVDQASGEFTTVAIAALRPGFTEATYRDFRDSFDVGACAQAGGVTGHAEAELGGRRVFIGSCAQQARTYHAWLEDEARLVAVTASASERRLGERLMGELTP